MSEPTRYSPMHGDEYEFTMRADANGDYVEFDDYESLRQQLAGWVDQHHRDSAELRRLCAARDEQRDGRLAQAERAAAAESRIAELEQQLAEARAGRVPEELLLSIAEAAKLVFVCNNVSRVHGMPELLEKIDTMRNLIDGRQQAEACRHCHGAGSGIGNGGYDDDQCDHCEGTGKQQPPAGGVGLDELVTTLKSNFPLFDDDGLDENEHCCEWSLQQDRKRLHSILAAQPQQEVGK